MQICQNLGGELIKINHLQKQKTQKLLVFFFVCFIRPGAVLFQRQENITVGQYIGCKQQLDTKTWMAVDFNFKRLNQNNKFPPVYGGAI